MLKMENVVLKNIRKTKIFFDDKLVEETRRIFYTEKEVTDYIEKNNLDCVYFRLMEDPVSDVLKLSSFKHLVEQIINKTIRTTDKMKSIFCELFEPISHDYRFFNLNNKSYLVKLKNNNLKIASAYSFKLNNEDYLVYQEFNGDSYNYTRIFEKEFSTNIIKVENGYNFKFNKDVVIDFSELKRNLSKKEVIQSLKKQLNIEKETTDSEN